MPMDALTTTITTLQLCDPEQCPMAERCPVGPTPNLPCEVKVNFEKAMRDRLADTFTSIDKKPEVSLRVNMLLTPLLEQLMRLRMAEIANSAPIIGKSMNPIYEEIRKTIIAIDKVLTGAIKAQNMTVKEAKAGKGALIDTTSKGYYEMLLVDGTSSIEERVGLQ